jgi:Ca2+/Na+ antiporter|tara:strand:- start:1010 stop:1285 length:276 start_codon:yes stop_codon:yes gene_type:complete
VTIAIIAGAIFLFFKLTAFKYEKVWMYSIAFLLLFLLFTFLYVTSFNDVDISSFEGLVSGARLYFNWLVNLGNNAAEVTGNSFNFDGNFTE